MPTEPIDSGDVNFETLSMRARGAEQARDDRINGTIVELAQWYSLIVRASNDVFYIEHKVSQTVMSTVIKLRPAPPLLRADKIA